MSNPRTVITIATGKKVYVEMAANLARSFLLWHPQTNIQFRVVTDQPGLLPADLKGKIDIYKIKPGEFGEGFSSKLYLDKFAADGQTLFIDSDCLIFDRIDFLFDRFKDRQVSVIGNYISDGEWFGDIKSILQKFNLPHMPKFNGGIYYLEKGEKASAVYQTARELEKDYDNIGFVRLRNRPNDEVLMALAMQIHGQEPVTDDGTIMSDPQACPGGYEVDVINGNRWLLNPPPPHPLHQAWYPFIKVSPAIVHFLGHYTLEYPYQREIFKLKKAIIGQNIVLWRLQALLFIEYPGKLKKYLKDRFRGLYHKLFGFRKIKKSERLIDHIN
ncbi:MAG: hypothetical protein V4456_09430 [Bacteroidota bacterium]